MSTICQPITYKKWLKRAGSITHALHIISRADMKEALTFNTHDPKFVIIDFDMLNDLYYLNNVQHLIIISSQCQSLNCDLPSSLISLEALKCSVDKCFNLPCLQYCYVRSLDIPDEDLITILNNTTCVRANFTFNLKQGLFPVKLKHKGLSSIVNAIKLYGDHEKLILQTIFAREVNWINPDHIQHWSTQKNHFSIII